MRAVVLQQRRSCEHLGNHSSFQRRTDSADLLTLCSAAVNIKLEQPQVMPNESIAIISKLNSSQQNKQNQSVKIENIWTIQLMNLT